MVITCCLLFSLPGPLGLLAFYGFNKKSPNTVNYLSLVSDSLNWRKVLKKPVLALLFAALLGTIALFPIWGFYIWGKTDANVVVAIITMILAYYTLKFFSHPHSRPEDVRDPE